MALEVANYIWQMVPANPPELDPRAQGADHLRLIKACVQASFPNLGNPITVTDAQINSIPVMTTNITAAQSTANTAVTNAAAAQATANTAVTNASSAQSTANAALAASVPAGAIIMWSGSLSAIPSGWALCNGQSVNWVAGGSGTAPNLIDRFIFGAGNTAGNLATGGQSSVTPTITTTVANHTITQANLPNYNLTVTDPGHFHTVTPNINGNSEGGASGTDSFEQSGGLTYNTSVSQTGITVNSGGSGTALTHTATSTSTAVPLTPVYIAVGFIMKL